MAFAVRHPGRRRGRAAAAEDDAVAGRGGAGRGRLAAARGAWAVGGVLMLIARLVRLVVGIIALIIVAAIVLKVLGANAGNTIVKDIHDVGKFFVGPFDGMFSIKNAKLNMAVNWGIAAAVYLIVGHFIASLIARAAPSGAGPGEPVV